MHIHFLLLCLLTTSAPLFVQILIRGSVSTSLKCDPRSFPPSLHNRAGSLLISPRLVGESDGNDDETAPKCLSRRALAQFSKNCAVSVPPALPPSLSRFGGLPDDETRHNLEFIRLKAPPSVCPQSNLQLISHRLFQHVAYPKHSQNCCCVVF